MKEKKMLIVVDMQNDFIDGSLGTKEAQAIVPAVAARIREYRAAGCPVVATQDTHGEDYLDTREGKYLPVRHCIRGTEGWQIRPEILSLLQDCPIVEKPTFGSVRLPELVREWAKDADKLSLELIGLCTDICVVSNALLLKASFPEADLSVCAACCAGVTPQKHEAALETMRSCQINVM